MYYQQSPFQFSNFNWKQLLKTYFSVSSVLTKLILINIAVYLVFILFKIVVLLIGFLFQQTDVAHLFIQKAVHLLSCPASFETLLHQPWSIFTSIFFHVKFWHFLFNMIMLSVIGGIFRQFIREKHLFITYIAGGIFGNLLYMISYNSFPVFSDALFTGSFAMGASGGIMAIMAAITTYKPNHKINLLFIGPVKLMWITLVFVFIDILSIQGENAGGHIAHIGGVIYGALSVLFYLKYNITFPRFRKDSKKKMKYATSRNYSYNERPLSDEEYNANKVILEKKTDEILDKISKNGYDSLTKEEKDFLFKQKR